MRKRKPKPVAVLGSGPAGLLAAQAARVAGREVDIFAIGEKSTLVGPQYLYQRIPGVTAIDPETYVRQIVRGTMAGYREKLYGGLDPGWIERPMKEGYDAWSLQNAYNVLWKWYEPLIHKAKLDYQAVFDLLNSKVYNYIFSAIPAMALCGNVGHQFNVWPIYVLDHNIEPITPDTIVFNGEPNPSWVRESHIFNRQTTEWPAKNFDDSARRPPPLSGIYKFDKPLRTNCDCLLPDVRRIGRFGKWKNETWAHDAYNEVLEVLGA